MPQALGIEAYANPETDPNIDNADLLQNLEGCNIHRFSPGTEEHAGTALMVTELPTGEGLGVQVTMNTDGEHIQTYNATQQDNGKWQINNTPTTRTLEDLETDCPALTIQEITHKDIMDPATARLVAILGTGENDTYAIDIHLHDDGTTEFFEIQL